MTNKDRFRMGVIVAMTLIALMIVWKDARAQEVGPATATALYELYGDQADIGPSPSYWSARNWPMYIELGCAEDVADKPACAY